MYKNYICAFLAALLLLSTAGCSSDNPETDGETGETTPVTETVAETEPERQPYIEKADYGGAGFHILSMNHLGKDYFVDELTGDAMNDAVFERTAMTEEYLGVKITYDNSVPVQDMASKLKAAATAGDDAYQFALLHAMESVNAAVSEGLLLDWNTIASVDMSREYWNHNIVKELELYGKNYIVRSDYMLSNPLVVFVNNRMIADNQLDNPYTLVREGRWDLDTMVSMAETVMQDVNGDGVMNEKDVYGYATMTDWQLTGYLYAGGMTVCTHDGDNLVIALNNEKTINYCQKVYDFLHAPSTFGFAMRGNVYMDIANDRCLFNTSNIDNMLYYRDSEVEIGILPYPKYDAAQERYMQYDLGGLMCMPMMVQDREMAGKVVEMLSYYSMETTVPAYYTVLFGEKLARDVDSVEMLSIVFDNIVYDAGMNYFGLGTNYGFKMVYLLMNLCNAQSFDFASYYAKNAPGFEKEIAKFMEKVQALP